MWFSLRKNTMQHQHFSLYHDQTIDFIGVFTDFKSVSNSEFFKAFTRLFFLQNQRESEGEMRKNYFAKLDRKSVCHIERGLYKLSDGYLRYRRLNNPVGACAETGLLDLYFLVYLSSSLTSWFFHLHHIHLKGNVANFSNIPCSIIITLFNILCRGYSLYWNLKFDKIISS